MDSLAQLLSSYNLIVQDISDSKFALVALGRATSAKLENFDEHVNMVSQAMQSIADEEEQALKNNVNKFVGQQLLPKRGELLLQPRCP